MSELAWKALRTGRVGTHSGVQWPEPGVWTDAVDSIEMCVSGWHVCDTATDLLGWLHEELWLVEWDGESIAGDDKRVVKRARLVVRVDAWDDRSARLFAVDCAEHVLHIFEDKYIEAARRFVMGEIDRNELDAARDAARAARDAAGAARAAAGAAAWAAWDAERSWQGKQLDERLGLTTLMEISGDRRMTETQLPVDDE